MKKSKIGKIIALAGMIALLVVTGYLNVYLNAKADETIPGNAQQTADFFETYRTDRIAVREQTVMYLDSIINSELSSQESIDKAQQEKISVTKAMETEIKLEAMIKALGFDDTVVSSSDENYNVILKASALSDNEVAKVLEVVTTTADVQPSNVIIIPVEG